MLGSTADSLFWMFRYIERVENTLCMIESGFQLYLLSSSNLNNEWDAILRTNSVRHHFLKKNNSLDSLNIINANSKTRIEKCIALTNEEYSYALSLQADCVPDSKRMIIQAKKKLEGLEALLTLSKLI